MESRKTIEAGDDEDLLTRARGGDEDAFIAIFQRHRTPVFRFLMHMCGSKELAEEVVQEVFLALLSRETTYSASMGDLGGFVIGIARNQLRKHLRRMGPTANLEKVPEVVTRPEIFERISREQELTALRIAILKLPPRYREVVVLCEIQGVDLLRASEQLGCALGTVKSRLNRARSILRAKLRAREGCPA